VRFLDGVGATARCGCGAPAGLWPPTPPDRQALRPSCRRPAARLSIPTRCSPSGRPSGPADPGELEQELVQYVPARVRHNSGESEDGVGSVGVAVVHPDGRVAALSLAAPVARPVRPQVRAAAAALKQAAAELAAIGPTVRRTARLRRRCPARSGTARGPSPDIIRS